MRCMSDVLAQRMMQDLSCPLTLLVSFSVSSNGFAGLENLKLDISQHTKKPCNCSEHSCDRPNMAQISNHRVETTSSAIFSWLHGEHAG